jgi:hypothetical protein
MVVLDDSTHAKRGIARNNQQRAALERGSLEVPRSDWILCCAADERPVLSFQTE